jgi:uncharacterized protein DUF1566
MEDAQASPEKKEEAAPAKAAKAVAKPKVAAKAKPAAKEKPPAVPLVDNGDGTVTDPTSGLMWKKTDAWIDMHKFYLWSAHREYVDKFNKEKFAGYENWRIPSKAEAMTIFDKTKECMDKNGTMFPLDPVFEAGGASNTWISECSDEKIIRFDGKIGVDTPYPTQDVWSSMRLVRKEGEAPPPPVGGDPVAVEAEAVPASAETTEAKTADAPAKAAAPKPAAPKAASGGGTPAPTPKKEFSSAEKAAMLARAKAHAAEKRARKG